MREITMSIWHLLNTDGDDDMLKNNELPSDRNSQSMSLSTRKHSRMNL